MADRAKFLDFLDMIDGGGAGQRGNQFEGGGIFSMLANLMPINPYGSEDKVRREARDAFFAEQGITPQQAAATPAVIRALQYDAGPITQDMKPQRRPQPNFPNYAPPSVAQTNRMMDVNVVPTSGPSPRVAEEITRMRNAQRMMDINAVPVSSSITQPSGMFADQLTRNAMNFTGVTPVGEGTTVSPRREDYSQTVAGQPVSPQQSYKSDPTFMSVVQNDATFLSMPEAARQNIYNLYLQRRNMQ